MWKKIHVDLEFLRLEFHRLLFVLLLLPLFFFPSLVILLHRINQWFFFVEYAFSSPWFFFVRSAFSREVFGSGTSASSSHFGSPILLFLPISGSSSLSSSSFVFFFGTRVPCGKNLSISVIRTQVFEAQFFHQTRASQAWDVIFLISFQFLLTNYIVWQTPTILQITPNVLCLKSRERFK